MQVILNIGWTVKTLTNEICKRNINPQISKTFITAVTRFIVLSFTKHVSIWVKVTPNTKIILNKLIKRAHLA